MAATSSWLEREMWDQKKLELSFSASFSHSSSSLDREIDYNIPQAVIYTNTILVLPAV